MIRYILVFSIFLFTSNISFGQTAATCCDLPNGESTVTYGRDTNAQLYYFADFVMTLQGSLSWNNWQVVETTGAVGTDTCYFTGSPYGAFTRVSGSSWYVGQPTYNSAAATNKWGTDVVGYSNAATKYYQTHVKLPCGATITQVMEIRCSTTVPLSIYSQDTVSSTVQPGGVIDCRQSVCSTQSN